MPYAGHECPDCSGHGYIRVRGATLPYGDIFTTVFDTDDCPTCEGDGWLESPDCIECGWPLHDPLQPPPLLTVTTRNHLTFTVHAECAPC